MKTIPFLSLEPQHALTGTEIKEVLTNGFEKNWYILGDSLKRFEEEYARFSGVQYCLGVGNGHDALYMALRACSIGPGDEVLVPANTYIATWLSVSRTGATIVPVEPDALTFTLDVNELEKKITTKSKLILPVHLYGHPCNMTSVEDLAKRYQLLIIEDNAQAHGASWNGKVTGSFGDINATSFYPTKNLGALGDGGAITTNSESFAGFVRRHRNYGFTDKDHCEQQGINSRLDDLQAAVLSVKLKYLSRWNEQRRKIALQYGDLLKGVGDLELPTEQVEARHVYHLFVIRSTYRDKLKEYLKSSGVETMIHYPIPPHLQQAYTSLGFKKGDFPVTEQLASTSLSLPLWPGLKDDQIHFICDRIQNFFNRYPLSVNRGCAW
ncbi:MAG: aminotransferase [Marivirga sp.]|nr:aminotransferase [Marivirga sp.]